MRSRITSSLTLAALLLVAAPGARALTGSGVSPTKPVGGNDPGWGNVGKCTSSTGSCVYLGSYATGYWVLTAGHVVSSDGGAFDLGGHSYGMVAGSGVRLTNADSSPADLYMFRVTGDSVLDGLSNIKVSGSAPTSSVSVIGYGGGTQGIGSVQFTGNTYPAGTFSAGGGSSALFQVWSSNVGLIGGDSGGGMFSKINGQWELTGIMEASDLTNNAPGSYYGYGSQLSGYSAQINSYLTAVPEPSTYALMAGGAGLAAIAVRRRRHAGKVV